jgi:hypothetical protein
MHSKTTDTLDRLEQASWFSRVGINAGSGVAVVSSWPEAIKYCDSSEWEDLQGEALNQYRRYIAHRSMERLNAWNDSVRELQNITRPLVARKTAAVVRENNLPDMFNIQVKHDIVLFCMEAEYADVCPPAFFTSIGEWYLKGHFPCGWWGVFPEGKPVIY